MRIRPQPALEDVECVGRGVEHRRAGRPRPVVDAHDRIADDPRPRPVVGRGGHREIAHVRRREGLGQAVGADRGAVAARRQHQRTRRRDPDHHGAARWRLERVAVVRPVEGDPAADPRQPAVEVDDPVRLGEQPVRAGQVVAKSSVEPDPDPGRGVDRQDPAERDDDRLIAPRGARRDPVDRDRLELDAAEPCRDRIELDPVDRRARGVADRRRRVDRDLPRPPRDAQ